MGGKDKCFQSLSQLRILPKAVTKRKTSFLSSAERMEKFHLRDVAGGRHSVDVLYINIVLVVRRHAEEDGRCVINLIRFRLNEMHCQRVLHSFLILTKKNNFLLPITTESVIP